MGEIDFSAGHGPRALERLRSEVVVWLTTTSAQGAPQPSPVWFLWQEDRVVIYSPPNTPKLRAIAGNPNVALNFNSSDTGDDVVIFRGTAEVLGVGTPADTNAEYIAKYGPSIERIGNTPAQFAAEYSTLIQVTPTRLRAY